MKPLLSLWNVEKRFGTVRAVNGVSLDIRENEFFALLGASGSGKTTLLRMLAGFETPTSGAILLDGKDISRTPPNLRPLNLMFQSYALFPHMTVAQNIAYGLEMERLPKPEIQARVDEILTTIQLSHLAARKPDQLSGGQRQRVALARALVKRPRLLLLDEPLGALDKKLRDSTQRELMDLQRRLGTSFIIVTHDQDEAMTMADRIGVMNHGRLVQVATPRQLYEQPASRWVAEFVGDVNIFEGRIESREDQRLVIACHNTGAIVAAAPRQSLAGEAVCVAIRPEKMKLSRQGPAEAAIKAGAINRLEGTVSNLGYLGDISSYGIALDAGATLRVSVTNTARVDVDDFRPGERVVVWFEPDDCVVLDP